MHHLSAALGDFWNPCSRMKEQLVMWVSCRVSLAPSQPGEWRIFFFLRSFVLLGVHENCSPLMHWCSILSHHRYKSGYCSFLRSFPAFVLLQIPLPIYFLWLCLFCRHTHTLVIIFFGSVVMDLTHIFGTSRIWLSCKTSILMLE